MTPEQLEEIAGTAFETFVGGQDQWSVLAETGKAKWRDEVTTRDKKPEAEPSNKWEECVKVAYDAVMSRDAVPDTVEIEKETEKPVKKVEKSEKAHEKKSHRE